MKGDAKRIQAQRAHREVLLALSWYYPQIHRGVAEYARGRQWHLTADLDDPIPKHWNGDGVLTHLGAHKQLWQSLSRLDVPIVDLTESRPELPLPRVAIDNAAIGTMAAEFFVNRGHRHCAMVHRWDLGVSHRRKVAFATALARVNLPCHTLCLQQQLGHHVDNRARRHERLVAWITRLPKPLAVLASRDDEAVEILDACLEAGLHVPEQVSVLGVDNTDTICECLRVPLSSIDSNLEQVGFEGAALLDRLMAGEPLPAAPIYVAPAGIVERQSTDMFASSHERVAGALRFIRDNYSRPIGVPDIARAVVMSRSGLEKAFREHFMRAPGEELRRIRLEHVRRLLRESDAPVIALAMASGFQSPQHLCRAFRQRFGVTPKQYRLQSRS